MTASWAIAAARLPLGFAQVREDPWIDGEVLQLAGAGSSAMMVASGGCTAAYLAATTRVSQLVLVDPNPAQIALARLKLDLLTTAEVPSRMRLLGHAAMTGSARAKALARRLGRLGYGPDVLGPADFVAARGPDHAGRYEVLFAELRDALKPHARELGQLLALRNPKLQAARLSPACGLAPAMRAAFQDVMALDNLVALFGEGATRNPRLLFAEHFWRQTLKILRSRPAAGNPFLAQVFLGRFRPGCEHAWLRRRSPRLLPDVTWQVRPMADALASASSGQFDVVHLSNILDWLSPVRARETLDLAANATRTGGWVVVRQLNSTLDIPALGKRFEWQRAASRKLLAGDRSFFYRSLHLGRRR